jgi:hypothetical protein
VHYHLGKANVVADALSYKDHYNYLPAIRLTGEKSSTWVLPDLSLFNIALTPTLKSEIIIAQKNDEGMGYIKRRIKDGDPKVACFCEDAEGALWFKDRLVVPKKEALKKKILDEAHTSTYQDVSWFEATILVDRNEMWDSLLCVRMWYMPED